VVRFYFHYKGVQIADKLAFDDIDQDDAVKCAHAALPAVLLLTPNVKNVWQYSSFVHSTISKPQLSPAGSEYL
jgi:hypothetical protein